MNRPDMIPVAEIDAYIRRELLPDVDAYRQVGPVALARKESVLLRLLMHGRVVTTEAFALADGRHAAGECYSNVLKVYVFRLRGKLRVLGVTIDTIEGQGVRMGQDSIGRVRAYCGAPGGDA